MEKTNNKTIAKNTILLYFRMLIGMIVSLYTSRLVLKNLGVEDYGIYQTVGGIIGFLDMVNGFMVNGVMRFLTVALGVGDIDKLKRTFNTTMIIQLIVALIIVILAETVGMWFLLNKLIIPAGRMVAAIFILQFAIISAVFSISQVPYGAIINAHEKMGVFAGLSLFDVFAKLGIVMILPLCLGVDSLILYGFLLMIVSLTSMIISRVYCIRHFEESRLNFSFDKKIFKEIASYSAWNVVSTFGTVFSGQGMVVLTNMFFAPAIVAARSISLTVSGQAINFVNSFRSAINPQIIKSYSAGNKSRSHTLLLASTQFSFYMVLLVSFPLFLLLNPILSLWLGTVPYLTEEFTKIILIQNLFSTIVSSFYTAIYAHGRLKEFALSCSTLQFLQFPIVYVLFKLGFSPLALSWTSLIVYITIALVLDPWLLVNIVGYTYREIFQTLSRCLKVTIFAVPIPLIISYFVDVKSLVGAIILLSFSLSTSILSICYIGLTYEMRRASFHFVMNKIKRKK